MPLENFTRTGPILIPRTFRDTKDPCPVFDGKTWHLYGSEGSSVIEEWYILHATAPTATGPWTEQEPAKLEGLTGIHVAAPGMIFDAEEKLFHMFIQTDFLALGGTVEHLVSIDGHLFTKKATILEPIPLTTEAGIYDPHPAIIHGKKCITYSGTPEVGRPDLYLACSETDSWDGPWRREGRILAHEEVPHHNQRGHFDYEWGLEGSQLVELPCGLVMLIAVCFLPEGKRGTRQRVFFAASEHLKGPYYTLGTIINPVAEYEWESGENGHAAGVIVDDQLFLFYQGRKALPGGDEWRYSIAAFPVASVEDFAKSFVRKEKDIPVE